MKFLIVFACVLAVAALTIADSSDKDAKILKLDSEVEKDGFKYEFETDNYIRAQQEGKLVDKDLWVVKGEYEFKDPKGQNVKVTYTADDNGYQPKVSQ